MDPVIVWAGILLCLTQSAMFSGLNLACFSVSRLQLEIEASRHNEDAIKVLGLRKDANFLLTTILWGNVGVNTLLALLSGSVLGGVAAFLFSTVFITVFAEIIPQAYFSRKAMKVAALLSPAIKFYQVVFYPVAKPTAKVLDLWLGPEGVHYLREQLLKDYILKSVGAAGSDIDRFEGTGAVNFLALDSRRVGGEGHVVDPRSIVHLASIAGRLQIPAFGSSRWESFVQQVQASGKKWIVLADPEGAPGLVLNSNHLLRVLFSSANDRIDVHEYCVEPIVTNNPEETLEQVLLNAGSAGTQSPHRGVILVWGEQKRIIAHTDVLHRLFEGVLSAPPISSAEGPFHDAEERAT